MAVFIPRVFVEIFGEMEARLISFTPLTDVNFGSIFTTMLEAAAQEDDEQYFQMLRIIRAFALDTTTGTDLDDRAFEFGLTRLAAQAATSIVTVDDSAITKVTTNIYSGKPGPAATTFAVNGDSDTGFPTSGAIVIGRGTPNVETVTYTSITVLATFVTFNLSGALAFDHGTDETIVLSQGGDRLVPGGTVVFVPSSDINARIDYTTNADATVFDGESQVTSVDVTAVASGTGSNVPVGSIILFDSFPFSTATVTNPNRITDGKDIESDQELRDRIKDTIQSLSRGTGRSIITSVLGVISTVQNKRVISAALIEPTIPADVVKLFIDDGTGFLPTFADVGVETIVAAATGGEKFLKNDRGKIPIVKAFVETQNEQPYALSGTEELFVDVGGNIETVTFEGTDFDSPGAATTQEVLTRINSVATLFEARVSNGGTKVRIFARANTGEEIRVTGGTANTPLNFPTDEKFTTKLYRERNFAISLLSKDGRTAAIEAGNTETYDLSVVTKNLMVVVDGKTENPVDIFFKPSEFTNPATVTADELCAIIERQSPGLTCQLSSNNTKIRITSNTERSSNSKLQVVGTFDQVWNEESSTLIDRTAESASASTFTAFGDNLDELYVGHTTVQFDVLALDFSTVASVDVLPTFSIFTGTVFENIGVIDQTNGFTQDGNISWGRDDRWVKTSVNGSAPMFFLRMTRNEATVGTDPIIDKLVVSSANLEFGFSETEVVGRDKDYTLNRFIGQLELESPLISGDLVTLGSNNTRAFVTSGQGNFGLSGGEVLDMKVDGAATQSYTFVGGDFSLPGSATPAEVQTVINREFTGVTATLVDSALRVKVATNKFVSGSIEFLVSTANTVLLFPTGVINNLVSHFGSLESGAAEPYSFTANDTVVIVVDGNLANNFTLPLFFASALTGATDASTLIDTTLSATFPLAADLTAYEIEMITGAQAGERKIISTYTPGTGTITTTTPFSGTPVATDTYQILATNADQVARFWNNLLLTTASTDIEIKTSSSGTKVQIASLQAGESGSIQVASGAGNTTLLFPALTTVFGVDGYRFFTGLAQQTQFIVDGREDDQENFPGIRAAGVQVEVIEPIAIPIEVEVDVTPGLGIELISINNEIKSAISNVINTLAVGGDVVASDIVCAVRELETVIDVKLLKLEPKPIGEDNVPIADSELARINDEDIVIG